LFDHESILRGICTQFTQFSISGGERSRWEQSIAQYEEQLKNLIGDCAVAAAFRSYAGPFPANYRKELVAQHWLASVRSLNIPCTPDFSFAYFLASPSDVMSWSLEGIVVFPLKIPQIVLFLHLQVVSPLTFLIRPAC
jgi:hypothetical protein